MNIVVDTAGSLFAGALLLKLVFPGLDIATIIIILAVVAVYLLGTFSTRVNARGAWFGVCAGTGCGVILFVLNVLTPWW